MQVDYGQTPGWQLGLRGAAIAVSIVAHLVAARYAFAERRADEKKDTWVEMAVVEPPPPPPEQPPPPPPEPQAPKPERKKVDFQETVQEPPPEAPPPQEKKPRRIHGLSANSFAQGGGTGLTVRAGTTVEVAATQETVGIEEAEQVVSFVAATVRPRCAHPDLEIPQEVVDENVEGQVKVLFDVDPTGRVVNVRVTQGLHPAADAACVRSWSKARCRPGKQGNEPVTVTNMPHLCTYRAIE